MNSPFKNPYLRIYHSQEPLRKFEVSWLWWTEYFGCPLARRFKATKLPEKTMTAFHIAQEKSSCNKLDLHSTARRAIARAIGAAATGAGTSADACALLRKVRDGERRILNYPCIAERLLERLLETLILDRPSADKGSPSEDVYNWVYDCESIAKWLWWRRGWERFDAFSKKWIIRLAGAVLEETRVDAKIREYGYWQCSTIRPFVRFAKKDDDPTEFLVAPELVCRLSYNSIVHLPEWPVVRSS